VDGWFCGYQTHLVGVAWLGFDQPKTLGKNQTGGRIALPIWIEYMGKVLKGVPEAQRTVPEGVVAMHSDADPAGPQHARGTEYYYREFVPTKEVREDKEKEKSELPPPNAPMSPTERPTF
jgi:penicillin-binding protein 1A